MTLIRVWGPKANEIKLESHHGQRIPMNKEKFGWYSLDDPNIKHGVDYAFYIDGEGPFPDPRSPWQPNGVHLPSRWVDHSAFKWNDAGWQQPPLGSALFYELHVGTFTPQGTFDAVIERLDYLVNLGVTHVEIMPVAEFSGNRGWGYDGASLYAPHQAYGGPDALKRLVDACHQRGLAIVLDVVYNHLGPVGNYLNRFGPYFTGRHFTPWGDAVNMDGIQSEEVRQFFINNALMWLRDYHMDGLRIDAVHAIIDTSATHFLEQLASEVKSLEIELGRHLILIAESDLNDSRIISPIELGGYGLDAQWNEDFHHALHALLTNETARYYQDFGKIGHLAKVLTHGLVYDGSYSVYRSRLHGKPASGISAHQYVGCLQNHDQIGNRALGERICQILSKDKIKIGAGFVLTAPFLPMIFQGEEWGASTPFLYFTDHQEPELGEAVYEGRKREFSDFFRLAEKIPHPQKEETFLQSKLRWEELGQQGHAEIQEWYRSLILLRQQQSDLKDGRLEKTAVNFEETQRWLMMTRGSILVVCNFSDNAQKISCTNLSDKKLLLSSNEGVTVEDKNIFLPAVTIAIFQTKNREQVYGTQS